MSSAVILDILQGLPGVMVNQVGSLWQISVANHAGAREDGVSLALDLRAKIDKHVERIVKLEDPVALPEGDVNSEPGVALIDEVFPFMSADANMVPEGLADLVRENEAYGDAQARLWALYVEIQNKLMLGLATEEDARLHTRLHGHLAWISKGAVEVTRD